MTAASPCWVEFGVEESTEWREADGDAVGEAGTGPGTGDGTRTGVVVGTLGTELLLPPPKSDAKGLDRRDAVVGVKAEALVVDGAETARCAGRGGSGGLTGRDAGRGGRGREDVCEGRVNVGYSVDGCCDDERGSGRSGRMERAAGRVVGLMRSWKILAEG